MRRNTTPIIPEIPTDVTEKLNLPANVAPDVLHKAIQGDIDAFGQIYETYQSRVTGMCYRRIPFDDVEDVAHTVWEHVLRRIGKFQVTEVPFSAYLAIVTRNAINSYYRQRGHLNYSGEISPERTRSEDPLDDPEEVVQRNELQNMLELAIAKLPPTQMKVIQLRFQKGFSLYQTAQALDKKENNVKQLQYKGVKKLQQLVDLDKQ